jgi:hypothetical protein
VIGAILDAAHLLVPPRLSKLSGDLLMEVTLFRFRGSLCQAGVFNRSSRNSHDHNQKHEAIRIPYAYMIQYLFFHKSSERPLPPPVDFANPMPISRWEPAIGTGGSGARKESTYRVAGAIEAFSRRRFGRLHF